MANRVKEDEKNERIIRSLLKLPQNRRCINCNSLGPQYVCTNFWTFVCTTCSGIHREFTHRVKSISMAKFTSQEVTALQGGGNERAKEIYFKEWDPQRHSFPDSSNSERLRDFIKHVYVDKRYTGERSVDKTPRVKMGEESYENRRIDTYQGGSRSPPYEDTNERRYNERPSPGGRSDDNNFRYNYDERRSPGYDRENRQYGDYRRSPARPEVVNDWRRDDRFGNGRRPEDRRISDGDSKSEGRSPDRQKDLDMSSPPMVRPVRDILGDNVSPLRISEPPKANGGRAAEGSTHTQRTASSSSLGSTNGNPVELKRENSGILIDFDADPEPPVSSAVPLTHQTTIGQSIAQPMNSSNDNNWASFDFSPEAKVSQAPSNVNTLESVLSQLFVPASVSVHSSGMPSSGGSLTTAPVGNPSMSTFSGGVPAAEPVSSFSTFPPSGALEAVPGLTSILPVNGGNSFVKVNDAGQWPSMQPQQHSLFPATGSQPTAQQFTPSVGGSSNQPWNSSFASNTLGPLSTPAAQAPQAVSIPAQEVTFGVVSQPSHVEVKSSGRKVLPEDLFAATYPSFSTPLPGWQTGPPGGMGFTMQYNSAVPMPTFSQSAKSSNPFDLNNEPPPVQAPTFPSMVSLQGALPNMPPPTGLLRTSSLGTPSPMWMPSQSSSYTSAMPPQAPSYAPAMPPQAPTYAPAMPPQAPSYAPAMPPQAPSYAPAMPPQAPSYAPAMPPQAPSYASAMLPRAYIGQQVPSNMPPPRHQGVGGFGSEGAAFGSPYSNQQLAGRYSAPATPNSFSSVGGNPFG